MKVKTTPKSVFFTSISPLCFLMIEEQIESPSPVPSLFGLVVKKDLKILLKCVSSIMGPLLAIAIL